MEHTIMDELEPLGLVKSAGLSLESSQSYVLLFADQKKCSSDAGLFAVAVSEENQIKVYSRETFCSQGVLEGHQKTVTGLVFCVKNSHHIWSSSLDGTVRCWDIASQDVLLELQSDKHEPYSALDISYDGKFLCAGTEKVGEEDEEDVSLYAWNTHEFPTVKQHGKYDDLHSDDITQVLFHPQNTSLMATGSTDGLVCLLDVSCESENDMLLRVFNTESSVNKVGFFGPAYEYMFATTHIETVHFWACCSGDQLGALKELRQEKECPCELDYIVDGFYHEPSQRLFFVVGTFRGQLKILHVKLDGVEHFQNLNACHSSSVRCVLFTMKTSELLVGGEDGMMSLWAPQQTGNNTELPRKSTSTYTEKKKKRLKPYKVMGH